MLYHRVLLWKMVGALNPCFITGSYFGRWWGLSFKVFVFDLFCFFIFEITGSGGKTTLNTHVIPQEY